MGLSPVTSPITLSITIILMFNLCPQWLIPFWTLIISVVHVYWPLFTHSPSMGSVLVVSNNSWHDQHPTESTSYYACAILSRSYQLHTEVLWVMLIRTGVLSFYTLLHTLVFNPPILLLINITHKQAITSFFFPYKLPYFLTRLSTKLLLCSSRVESLHGMNTYPRFLCSVETVSFVKAKQMYRLVYYYLNTSR